MNGSDSRFRSALAIAPLALLLLILSCASERPPGIAFAEGRLKSAHREWPPIPFGNPGMDHALVKSVEYSPGLSADIYWPPDFDFSARLPVVVFALGLPESHFLGNIGTRATDTGLFVSMCAYVAANGAAALVINSNEPLKDFYSCVRYLSNDTRLRLDFSRMFLWTRSEHAAFTLALASERGVLSGDIKGVCLFTPFLPATAPLPLPSIPVLIVSAGRDVPARETEALRYSERLGRNGNTVTRLRFEKGKHAFEIHQLDLEGSVETVAASLDYAVAALSGSP